MLHSLSRLLVAATVLVHPTCNSWYNGANVPGKKRMYMGYTAGRRRGEAAEALIKAGADAVVKRGGLLGPRVFGVENRHHQLSRFVDQGSHRADAGRRVDLVPGEHVPVAIQRLHVDAPGWFARTSDTGELAAVAAAVLEGRRLRIRYRKGARETSRTLDPLGLVAKAGVGVESIGAIGAGVVAKSFGNRVHS